MIAPLLISKSLDIYAPCFIIAYVYPWTSEWLMKISKSSHIYIYTHVQNYHASYTEEIIFIFWPIADPSSCFFIMSDICMLSDVIIVHLIIFQNILIFLSSNNKVSKYSFEIVEISQFFITSFVLIVESLHHLSHSGIYKHNNVMYRSQYVCVLIAL